MLDCFSAVDWLGTYEASDVTESSEIYSFVILETLKNSLQRGVTKYGGRPYLSNLIKVVLLVVGCVAVSTKGL